MTIDTPKTICGCPSDCCRRTIAHQSVYPYPRSAVSQRIIGHPVALVERKQTGKEAAQAAWQKGMQLHPITRKEAKKCNILLPRRWVVERSFGWVNCFRRLKRDYERLRLTLARLLFFVLTTLMLHNAANLRHSS